MCCCCLDLKIDFVHHIQIRSHNVCDVMDERMNEIVSLLELELKGMAQNECSM